MSLTPQGNENAQPIQRLKSWTVGTLVYTSGSLASLFGWLLWGDFAWQMRERAITPVSQLLVKKLHASDILFGLLFSSIPAALGLLLGPVIGTASDRHRGRMGRRIPFLLAPTPFAALAIIGLAFTPEVGRSVHHLMGGSSPGLESVSLGVFALLWTIFEVSAITTQGIYYGLINDVVPHDLIGRFFGVFRMVSLLAGIIFNTWIIGHAEENYRLIYIYICIGVLYGLGVSLMCLRVKEGEYPTPEPMAKGTKGNPLKIFVSYFRETFSHPHYRWIYAAALFVGLAAGPVNNFSVPYAKSLNLDMTLYGRYLAVTYIISFCLSFLLGVLADKFHPLRMAIAALFLYSIATLFGGIFARTHETFAIAFIAHGVLSGCLFTVIVPTYQSLFPKERFGEFNSAAGLLSGFAGIIVPPAIGALLDASGHIYRYTFLISSGLALMGCLLLIVVYQKFMALGGPKEYVAPH